VSRLDRVNRFESGSVDFQFYLTAAAVARDLCERLVAKWELIKPWNFIAELSVLVSGVLCLFPGMRPQICTSQPRTTRSAF